MEEKEKRRLRSQERSKAASKLFDFDSANPLLFKNRPIHIDNSSSRQHRQPFEYYGSMSRLPERSATSKSTKVTRKETEYPRRRHLKTDPLSDDVYLPFHRKMKRDEKFMTGSDRNRIANEVDNFRLQLMLLQQNNWARHLPKITYINDKSDMAELSWKRQATVAELQRLVSKYENWCTRNESRLADVKDFESRKSPNAADSDPVEEDDSSDVILGDTHLREEREAERIARYGPPGRLKLRNGYDLVFGPFQYPRIEPSIS